jgi:hypothetical protein
VVDHGIILLDHEDLLRDELRRMEEKLAKLGSNKIILSDGSWYWDLKPNLRVGEVFDT